MCKNNINTRRWRHRLCWQYNGSHRRGIIANGQEQELNERWQMMKKEADKGGVLPHSQHISQTPDSGGTCERSGAETMGWSFTTLLICKSVHREEGSLKLHPILYYLSTVSLRKKGQSGTYLLAGERGTRVFQRNKKKYLGTSMCYFSSLWFIHSAFRVGNRASEMLKNASEGKERFKQTS